MSHMTIEVEIQLMMEVKKLLKQMYDMSESDWNNWDDEEAQNLISYGGDLYADYFRNNN